MNLSPLPIQKFFDNNGRPMSGGKLFTYEAGTSTKVATYTDSTGGAQNTNPIILDFRGECRLWIDPQLSYKFVLSPPWDDDPPTSPIWTVDNITAAPQAFDNAAVDTGPVNNIELSIPQISSPVAFTRVVFQLANTNTGAVTLQINGGTAHPLRWQNSQVDLQPATIIQDGIYQAIYDGSVWQLQGPTLQPGDIRLFGAVGDGVTDDAPAIQAAVDAVTPLGGSVIFPDGPYKWGLASQVTVTSVFPVNMLANMNANPNATANASYIKPLNNISGSLIKYIYAGTPFDGGAGTIRGLSFLDDTNRTFTMDAALDLDSFSSGIVENISIHKILGRGIRYGTFIQNRVDNIHIRYTGDTLKPAQEFLGGGDYQVQGNTFTNIISEVNYNAPHIVFASNSNDNKMTNLTFETAETSVTEEFNYITLSGLRNAIIGPTLNRRPVGGYAVEFATGASRCSVIGASTDVGAGRAYLFTSDRCEIRGGFVTGATSTVDPVVFVGVRNRLAGVHFFVTRSFDINSGANEVCDCIFDSPTETSGYFLTVTASGSQSKVEGNRWVGLPAGLGGLSINSDGVFSDNVMSGGGGGSTGINVNAANAVVCGNYIANFSTNINPNGNLNSSVIENNVGYVRRNWGATASVADGGTIPHGCSGTPTSALANCSVSGQIATIGALDATNITVAIKNHDGTAGTTQTIHWNATL